MNKFDRDGDLWIEVEAGSLPDSLPQELLSSFMTLDTSSSFGLAKAVTQINLTGYIRHIIQKARP